MPLSCRLFLAAFLLAVCTGARPVSDLKGPDMGYIYPAGGQAGTTIDVLLGGYDWTPDMQLFVHRPGVELVVTGPPGPIIVPEPPYWFGSKSYANALPLPREVPAKITIPRDCPPGPIFWQAANANGVTATGVLVVGDVPEVVEVERRKEPQVLPSLPVTVSGRLVKIEDVDRYRFTAPRAGLLNCSLVARRLGANFNAVVEIRDTAGKLVAEAYDTEGLDIELTFVAQAGAEYAVNVRDIDFRGDRSYDYRLTLTPAPRVVAAIPAAGKRGETRKVEFVGYGIASGQNKLESVTRDVTFPSDPVISVVNYRLETPHGNAPTFPLLVSDLVETVEASTSGLRRDAHPITLPVAVTGIIENSRRASSRPADVQSEHLYSLDGKKGEAWLLTVQAREIGSPLDPTLAVRNAEGKELVRADDVPGTVDCTLEFAVPADGAYTIAVGDISGKTGLRSSTYRLVAQAAQADFTLQAAVQRLPVMIGEKADLIVKVSRTGGFKEPVQLAFSGLPPGMTPEGDLVIPAAKKELKISLQSAADSASTAAFVQIRGTAKIGDKDVTRLATAPASGNLIPAGAADNSIPVVLVASILKPVCKVEPLEKDGGRSVHRGTTFPAPIVIERYDDFNGEIVLQMASQQSRHRQGITGFETIVPPGVTRIAYPCYMPEWLETDRTSRVAVIGVVKVKDPKGTERYSVAGVQGQITMTIEGALLKIMHTTRELSSPTGKPLAIPVKLSRSVTLKEPARLELVLDEELQGQLIAEPLILPAGQSAAVFQIQAIGNSRPIGRYELGIRATVLQGGVWPVISETKVPVEFIAGQ